MGATHKAALGSSIAASPDQVCRIGRDSEEVSVFTCFTVVTAAHAIATPNATAKAAKATRNRMSLPPT
jgi:hypothetical protein